MSFFQHIGGDNVYYGPPSRVYAWVDAPSEETGDGYTRLDCLDADWADRNDFASLTGEDASEEAERKVSMILWRGDTSVEQEGGIVELQLGKQVSADDADALHYLNLTGPPNPREVVEMRWPDSQEAARIARATALGEEDVSEESEIVDLLAKKLANRSPTAVAVYDVGQGACTALIANDFPALYFDVGGGALNNTHTFPKRFDKFCTTDAPPVVLSHWHYDHWSLVKRFDGDILNSPWIVPYQANLKPTAATLLGLIRRGNGGALICPPSMNTLRAGPVAIHDCAGKTANDCGIAMTVGNEGEPPIVLPGDARYKHIADLPERAHTLVVAHHGGNTRAKVAEIPAPTGNAAGRLIVSCGPKNSYNHPTQHSLGSHAKVGWKQGAYMSTSDRASPDRPEHIHLYWDANQPEVGLACGGSSCTLEPCRR